MSNADENTGINKYSDIINTQYPFPLRHQRMSLANRAPQFAPFAALTGFDEMVDETQRVTLEKRELSEDMKQHLGEVIARVLEYNEKCENNAKCEKNADCDEGLKQVTIAYYLPDDKKTGGTYTSGIFTPIKIKSDANVLITKEGTGLLLENIYDIQEI